MAQKTHWLRAEFMTRLEVQDARFELSRPRQVSGTRGGEVLTAEASVALWQGSISLAPMRAREAAEVQAVLTALEAPLATFDAFKPNQIGPASDMVGAALNGFSAKIEAVGSDSQSIKLSGLPSGYVISPGDFLSFKYEANGRQALHQVIEGATHDTAVAGSFFTSSGFMRVAANLRPGVTLGASVELIRPFCRAVIMPGSVRYGATRGGKTSGMAFDFCQTLRKF